MMLTFFHFRDSGGPLVQIGDGGSVNFNFSPLNFLFTVQKYFTARSYWHCFMGLVFSMWQHQLCVSLCSHISFYYLDQRKNSIKSSKHFSIFNSFLFC